MSKIRKLSEDLAFHIIHQELGDVTDYEKLTEIIEYKLIDLGIMIREPFKKEPDGDR